MTNKPSVQFFRLRPINFPTIRISQFASLYSLQQNLFSKCIEKESLKEGKGGRPTCDRPASSTDGGACFSGEERLRRKKRDRVRPPSPPHQSHCPALLLLPAARRVLKALLLPLLLLLLYCGYLCLCTPLP